MNVVLLPQGTQFGYDFDGDSVPDNQYGPLLGALASFTVGTQQQVIDDAAAAGTAVELYRLLSSDASFANDACAGMEIARGFDSPNPNYSGGGAFVPNPAVPAVTLTGTLSTSDFTSSGPALGASSLPKWNVLLPFGPALIPVDLVDVHVSFHTQPDGLKSGEAHGVIKESDVYGMVLPGIAAGLQKQIDSNPSAPESMKTLQYFDNGGSANPSCSGTCKNLSGSCAVTGDGKIDPCELMTHPLFTMIFAPDVSLFEPDGKSFHPDPMGTKDSMSVGFAFSTVPCSFLVELARSSSLTGEIASPFDSRAARLAP